MPRTYQRKIATLAIAGAITFLLAIMAPVVSAATTITMEFVRQYGSATVGPGRLILPKGIALSPDGSMVYITDEQSQISIYNTADGFFLGDIGSAGNADGQFNNPAGITFSADGTKYYIADTGNHRVQIFNTSDNSFVGTFGTPGDGNGQMWHPRDVGVSPDGSKLYVVSFSHVQVYDASDNSYLGRFGTSGSGDGQFNQAGSIAVSPDGSKLYVADTLNDRVQIFNADTLEFISSFGEQGSDGDFLFVDPYGLSLSPDGERLYVADTGNHRIKVYDTDDNSYITSYGQLGTDGGSFDDPMDVVMSKDETELYVADRDNNRGQLLELTVVVDEPTPEEESGSDITDANGDGIDDSEQDNVTAFTSTVTSKLVALEVDDNCNVAEALMKTENTHVVQDPGFDYPQGLMNFNVSCGTPGYTTTVKQFYYNTDPEELILRKYNPTSNAYFTINNAQITQSTISGSKATVVTYQVTDGGDLDVDGEANGIIVDPAGLANQAIQSPNTGIKSLKERLFVNE